MCIALISTAHPAYSLIVINNRDEFLHRPTSSPDWWPEPSSHVLGSRDLARSTHGTWMGVTKHGKIAVLTNYREDKASEAIGVYSRGLIVNSWLTGPIDKQATREFVQAIVASPEAKQVGGFSLVCGHINEPLAIVSNRSSDMDHITWVATEENQTRGLSNTSFDDRSWPKILDGERLMEAAIQDHVSTQTEDEDALIEQLLHVLSTDTLPRLSQGETLDTYINHLRKSIFIPIIGDTNDHEKAAGTPANGTLDQSFMSGAYGTQKQTVLLARPDGRVRYFERTLYDNDAKAIPLGEGDHSFEFTIQ
ncbi:hypothetical protein PENANT_c010G08447 [Penicillium antarcticum]|uniref:Uncharacterized protein n=1 Tax=Penicillium antarcticum TaxID=416450 RepID=A0A1V6Q972_9EURO|nr:uncharacterized protein N7508_000515 [Penicillium antarcticum]KAJ5320232.1 hypothetical protein N7508_000515 [Penicillium antarcticum]OQD85346.1 hypothetical protein PENANT_c010G08447 [Penicillium antarcticum]